jgi:hypothetical protein
MKKHDDVSFRVSSIALIAIAAAAATVPARRAAADPVLAKPAPYALAWQLRPAAAANVVRADTTVASYRDGDGDGTTVASTLLASYKVTPTLAPLLRIAAVHNTPAMGEAATSVSNLLVGTTWAPALAAPLRLSVLGAVTLPIGSGGGDTPDAAMATANRAGVMARSSMDNALFAVNDAAAIGGIDLAYVDRGLTLQVEATLFQLVRVRGDAVQPDSTKTNMTSGIHAGYFVLPWLSLGAELRYQRYLSTPSFVDADPTGANRDALSAAAGVRGHFKLGGTRVLRPGIAYARGLDDPMAGRGYDVVQIDVPFSF